MKDIRLCDNGEFDRIIKLSEKYNLGIEVQTFTDPYLDNMDKVIEHHRDKLKLLNKGKSLHAPYWDLNLGSKIHGIRNETMNMINFAYDTAKKLGCSEIVFHNGYIPGSSYPPKWVERAEKFWREFFENKGDSITICLENQFELDADIIKAEIDAVNDKRLKVCLDIGHAHANSKISVEEWIIELGDRIGYYHLHNNHGSQYIKNHNNDEHLGLTNGTIDIKNVLDLSEQYSANAVWSLEPQNEYMEESIKWLKKNRRGNK